MPVTCLLGASWRCGHPCEGASGQLNHGRERQQRSHGAARGRRCEGSGGGEGDPGAVGGEAALAAVARAALARRGPSRACISVF